MKSRSMCGILSYCHMPQRFFRKPLRPNWCQLVSHINCPHQNWFMSILNESAGLTERLNDFCHIRCWGHDRDVTWQVYYQLKKYTYPINKVPNLYDMVCWTKRFLQGFAPNYTMEYTFVRSFVLEMTFYLAGIKMGAIILQAKKH